MTTVIALGAAGNHVPLIKYELGEYFSSEIKISTIPTFSAFNKQSVLVECIKNKTIVSAYVLPPENGELYDGDIVETVRDHWKRMAEAIFPSRSVKELEVVSFDADPTKFWLDGLEQYQGSSREQLVIF